MTPKTVRDNTEPSGIRMTSLRFTEADEILIRKIKETYNLKTMTDVVRLGLAVAATGIVPKQRVYIPSELINKMIELVTENERHEKSKGRT